VLIDSPVEVCPASGDLDIGLIDKPAIADRVPGRPGRVDELSSKGLHPPVDRHVIHVDTTLGQQLLDIAIRQAVAQNQRTASAITPRGNRYPAGADDDTDFELITPPVSLMPPGTPTQESRYGALPVMCGLELVELRVRDDAARDR
jgi:hypothetical protein